MNCGSGVGGELSTDCRSLCVVAGWCCGNVGTLPVMSDERDLSSRRRRLEALRDDLWLAFCEADTNVKAQIAAQYRATLAELEGLPAEEELSARERFKARLAASDARPPSA